MNRRKPVISTLPITPGGGNFRKRTEYNRSRPSSFKTSNNHSAKTSSKGSGFFYDDEANRNRSFHYPPWENPPGTSIVSPAASTFGPLSTYPSYFQDLNVRSGMPGSDYSLATSALDVSRPGTVGSGIFRTAAIPPDLQFMLGEAPPLPRRSWEHTGLGSVMRTRKNDVSVTGSGVRFTLMSYNVLAPTLLEKHTELYGSCDPSHVDWENRLEKLLHQIEEHDPDILCLQEVEAGQFQLNFEPKLQVMGYRGVYKKKTRDKEDGCAIFYKQTKFLLLDRLDVEFFQPHVPLLNRDNIGLLVKLETRNVVKRQKLIVGTTHLLFNPKRLDVRMAQSQVLLAEIDRFSFFGFDRDGVSLYHPIVMTGDFNCKPTDSVVKLITDRRLQCLDNKGELVKLLKRNGFDTLLPPQCGITDQCQHYKIALERYKRWKSTATNQFELDLKMQNSLVNLYPYLELREKENLFTTSDACLLTPEEELISLLSPVTEGVEPIPSVLETTDVTDNKLLLHAAQKIAMHVMKTANEEEEAEAQSRTESTTELFKGRKQSSVETIQGEIDLKTVMEMKKCGMSCDFGTGNLTHNLHFRDIYSPKLDRAVDGAPVSTKQQGWVCVDYIFQSMVYNTQLKKVIEGKLKLIRRFGLFNRSQCKQIGEIPNADHPSDHFPLVAEFLLR